MSINLEQVLTHVRAFKEQGVQRIAETRRAPTQPPPPQTMTEAVRATIGEADIRRGIELLQRSETLANTLVSQMQRNDRTRTSRQRRTEWCRRIEEAATAIQSNNPVTVSNVRYFRHGLLRHIARCASCRSLHNQNTGNGWRLQIIQNGNGGSLQYRQGR